MATNWLTESGMAFEGFGDHVYDPGGRFANRYIAAFVNQVGHLHAFLNSWNYNSSTGFYMSGGVGFDSVFQLYNFAGMLPAGIVTAVLNSANIPYDKFYARDKK